MAEKLIFDDGLLELDINGRGLLRFNASDFNVYQRFLKLVEELPEVEKEYAAKVEAAGKNAENAEDGLALAGEALDKAKEIDHMVKTKLAEAFGPENDFDGLLGGVNIMAFGGNGERVITNLLNALAPYMESGIKRHMQGAAQEAVAKANANRAKRRTKK